MLVSQAWNCLYWKRITKTDPLFYQDDASSTSIQIHFHSNSPDPTKPPNLLSKCDKIVFKNNGMAFRPEDWQRLKRIAEGNPGKVTSA
jgi:hypothetical protein